MSRAEIIKSHFCDYADNENQQPIINIEFNTAVSLILTIANLIFTALLVL